MAGSACTLLNSIDLGVLFPYNTTNNGNNTTTTTSNTNDTNLNNSFHPGSVAVINTIPGASSSVYTTPKQLSTAEQTSNITSTLCNNRHTNVNCDSSHSIPSTCML